MKLNKTLALAALVAGGLFAGSVALQAQEKSTPPPAGAPPGGMRARGNFDTLAKALELTDDQKPKVKVIFDDRQQKQRDLRADTTTDAAAKRAKAKEIRDAASAKVKPILTPEQFTKWEKMDQGPRQRPQGEQPHAGGATTPPKAP